MDSSAAITRRKKKQTNTRYQTKKKYLFEYNYCNRNYIKFAIRYAAEKDYMDSQCVSAHGVRLKDKKKEKTHTYRTTNQSQNIH